MNHNEKDQTTLALTLWGESRGEPHIGQIAVAWVIANRASLKEWAGSLVGQAGAVTRVCLAPYQFSCWLESDPNSALMKQLNPVQYSAQLAVAQDVLNGDVADPTNGANHYFTIARPPGTEIWPPAWVHSMRETARIGHHVFYDSRVPAVRMLFQGCIGDDVSALNRRLREVGFDSVLLDDSFDTDTVDAVRAFQKNNGLTVDGVVGPRTRNALGL